MKDLKKYLISIVIPVFNAEKYIDRCIKSVLDQTFTNFELILIDDGSVDRSVELCQKSARLDSRIKLYLQENSGPAAARNKGLDLCTGDYVMFVDADDVIHPEMLFILLSDLLNNDADIAISAYSKVKVLDVLFEKISSEAMIITSKEAILNLQGEHGERYTVPWCKLYLRSLISEFRYPVGKRSEDEFVSYKILWRANKIVIDSAVLYFYNCDNSGSETKQLSSLIQYDAYKAFEEREEFFAQSGETILASISYWTYFDRIIANYMQIIQCKKDIDRKRKLAELKKMYNIKYQSGKYKNPGFGYELFYISPYLYLKAQLVKTLLK